MEIGRVKPFYRLQILDSQLIRSVFNWEKSAENLGFFFKKKKNEIVAEQNCSLHNLLFSPVLLIELSQL